MPRLPDLEPVLARILNGTPAHNCEGPTLDFKEDVGGSRGDLERNLAAAAICFANSAGGIIVVGINNKKSGIEAFTGTTLDPHAIKQRIYELSRPHLTVEAERHHQYNLLVIYVPQSAVIHADTQGRALRRINCDCLPMSPDEQARLREERSGIDWSDQPSDKSLEDVLPQAVGIAKRILSSFSDERRRLASTSTEDLLTALGVLSGRAELTRAGALMFCAGDEAVGGITYQYRNTPGGEPKAVHRLSTPLIVSFTRTMELVGARQTLTPISLPNGQQIVIEDFPTAAVREALSNAICHRDYHLRIPTTVDHSPTVFVVQSPGPLVSGVTTENILTTSSRPRNPALSKIVRVLGLAEELGRGVDRMYREMIRSGRQIPNIDGEYDAVRVTFVGGAPDTNIARFIAQLPEDEQEDTDTMLILLKLCNSRTATAANTASLLQKTVGETEMVLRRLSDDPPGLVEPTRATVKRSAPTYRLRSEALRGLGFAVTYNRRTTDEIDKKVIAHVREYGKITNRTLQNFLDVHVFKARDIIRDLIRRDILVRVSERQRGPGVEWGPGPAFPRTKTKRGNKGDAPPDQGSLFGE